MTARYRGPIVDVDVHHQWTDPEEVIEYLPRRWQSFIRENPNVRMFPPPDSYGIAANGGAILDTFGDDLNYGTDEVKLRGMLIDKFNVFRCVLTHDVGHIGGHLNPELAVAMCCAVNDWNIDRWLTRDERFYSVVTIPAAWPEEAAKEIRRVGKHPRMVGVLRAGNALGRPFGDPIYDPIHKAVAELGLTISHHWGNYDRPTSDISAVGGHLPSGIHASSQYSQQAMHYISSYIVSGTFEKYPSLRVLVLEYGVAWLPYLMTRLDNNYELLRSESSWVKKWPSDYIRSHIKLDTQPLEESPDPKQLIQLLETIDGVEDLLCFATDWPHWTSDDPDHIAKVLPRSWHRKVMCDNACDLYGWKRPAAVTSGIGVEAEVS